MTNGNDLKPCPFCGSKATVHSWWSDIEECGVASIGCSRKSYASGYECARIHVMRVDEKTALEDAVRIWNTRTLGVGECELVYGENDEGIDGWYTHCGGWFAAARKDGRMAHPKFCQLCGGKAVER